MKRTVNRSISLPLDGWELTKEIANEEGSDRSKVVFAALLHYAKRSKSKTVSAIAAGLKRKTLIRR